MHYTTSEPLKLELFYPDHKAKHGIIFTTVIMQDKSGDMEIFSPAAVLGVPVRQQKK
jgi:hypothetical protein